MPKNKHIKEVRTADGTAIDLRYIRYLKLPNGTVVDLRNDIKHIKTPDGSVYRINGNDEEENNEEENE